MVTGAQVIYGIKGFFSTVITLGSLAFILTCQLRGLAVLGGHPAVHVLILVLMLVLVAYLEGSQVAILAVMNRNPGDFRETRPRAYAVHKKAVNDEEATNVKRYLVGRQFFVIFVMMLTSQVTTFPDLQQPEWFPTPLWYAVVGTGITGALVVLMFASLMPQLVAEQYPEQFCNLPGTYATLMLTLVMEYTGIPNCCYLLKRIVCKLGGLKAEEAEGAGAGAGASSERTPRAMAKKFAGCAKCAMSTVITLAATAFVVAGIFGDYAVLGAHPVVEFVILVFAVAILAYLEGLQIAVLALMENDGEAFKESHPRGYAVHCKSMGEKVKRFLVGRQFLVIFVVFLISQTTTFPKFQRPEAVPEVLWFVFVKTGLYSALMVLAFGQLLPQLVAEQFPVAFMNLPGSWSVLTLCLFMEALGICHFSYMLQSALCWMFRLRAEAEGESKDAGKPEGGGAEPAQV